MKDIMDDPCVVCGWSRGEHMSVGANCPDYGNNGGPRVGYKTTTFVSSLHQLIRKTLEEAIPVRLQGKVYDEITDVLIGVLK